MLALRQDYLDYLDGHALPSPSPPQTATQLSYTRTRHSPGPRASFSSVDSPGHLPLRPPELYLPSPGLDNNGSTTTYEDKAGQYFPRHTLQAPVPQTYASPRDQVAQDQVQQLDYAPVGAQSRQRSEQPAAQHAYGHPQASGSHAVCDTSVASQHNAGQMASTLASPVAKAPRIHTNPKDRKRVEQQNIRDITNHWVDNMKITLGLNHKLSKNKTLEKAATELRAMSGIIQKLQADAARNAAQADAEIRSLKNQLLMKDSEIAASKRQVHALGLVSEARRDEKTVFHQRSSTLLNHLEASYNIGPSSHV